jgi:hypothetical protein
MLIAAPPKENENKSANNQAVGGLSTGERGDRVILDNPTT